jgi:hypothetical protein
MNLVLLKMLLSLQAVYVFADSYSCINKESAKGIIVSNLGYDYHRASVHEQQSIDDEITHYLTGLLKLEGRRGFLSMPNSYYRRTILVSCLGEYTEL